MSKKALLVGINSFVEPSWQLRGCVNDTLVMQDLLKTYFGFEEQGIRLMHDAQATGQGVRDGLAWLLSDYDGNDVRVFLFSSHGTQVDDQGDDEWECLDEVIVPHDHDWDKPFRDDELRGIFQQIPSNVSFTFIADCCHSGSIQKAIVDSGVEFKTRYLDPPRQIKDKIARKVARRDAQALTWARKELLKKLRETPQEEWGTKAESFLDDLLKRYRQNKYGVVVADRHVLLAACEDRQTAADAYLENEYRGAFSWAVGKAIVAAKGDLTYDQLIKKAASRLKSYEQKPQLECPAELRKTKILSPLGGS